MGKISKGYLKAAKVAIIWAVLDLLTYFIPLVPLLLQAFKVYDLAPYLKYFPVVAAVKAAFGGLILGIGAVRAKCGRRVRSLTAVTWMLVISVFSTWAIGMYCLTSVTAENVAERVRLAYSGWATRVSENSNLPESVGLNDLEKDYRFMNAVALGSKRSWGTGYAYGNEDSGFLEFPENETVYFSTALFDHNGELLISGADNYFYYSYIDEQEWEYAGTGTSGKGRTCFDPDNLTKKGKEILDGTNWLWTEALVTRFVGYYDGGVLVPQKIEYIDKTAYFGVGYHEETDIIQVARNIRAAELEWDTLYEDPDVTLSDQEKVIHYSLRPEVCYHPDMPGFTYGGVAYSGAADFFARKGQDIMTKGTSDRVYADGKLAIVTASYRVLRDGEEYDVQVRIADDVLLYYFVSVVYCDPWLSAAACLKNVYIFTFALALAMVWIIRRLVKENMVRTLRETVKILENTNKHKGYIYFISDEWQESKQLIDCLEKNRSLVLGQRDEIKRLTTALEYARSAEEQRRRMTSNIAHELKTPLAVIHSYAEGLKEHIAEEKRDKYVDVILSEVKRTDAMVLEMLDLSRLEAGKVKLAQDQFSLADMARSVFEKLGVAAGEKQLNIQFEFPEAFIVMADEKRIAQVVENFATNAVRYTPAGGNVVVSAYRRRDGVTFSVENDSEPLSQEALERVWESFYRADESRSSKGTGLGLAIAKSIVELHGGKCSVRNTATGVQFSFTI